MKLAYIGLGNLGEHIAMNLVKDGHEVAVFDLNRAAGDTSLVGMLDMLGVGHPAVPLVRGLAWSAEDNPASNLVRPAAEDMFR